MVLPSGFVREKNGNRIVFLLEDRIAALRELGFVQGEPTRDPVDRSVGRTAHPIYELPGSERRVLWKRCLRGGAMEKLLRDRHWRIDRFLRELSTTQAAIDAGARVAPTIGLAVVESASGFKRIEMVSQIVDGARDLGDALGSMAPLERRHILEATAGELRHFHGLGFLHGDLNVKNILWRPDADGGCEVTLIDLDPGAWEFASARITPEQNLMRLFRSSVKGELKDRWRLTTVEQLRFLHDYYRGDRRAIRRFWERALRRRRSWSRFRFAGRRGDDS